MVTLQLQEAASWACRDFSFSSVMLLALASDGAWTSMSDPLRSHHYFGCMWATLWNIHLSCTAYYGVFTKHVKKLIVKLLAASNFWTMVRCGKMSKFTSVWSCCHRLGVCDSETSQTLNPKLVNNMSCSDSTIEALICDTPSIALPLLSQNTAEYNRAGGAEGMAWTQSWAKRVVRLTATHICTCCHPGEQCAWNVNSMQGCNLQYSEGWNELSDGW